MIDVNEKDWKLYRKYVPIWQEHYTEKLVNEYVNYLQSDIPASTKFWKMKSRIYEDEKKPGVILKMSRSTMLQNLILLIKDNVITYDDLNEFSSDTMDVIRLYLH